MHPYISGWLAAVLACRLLTQRPLIHNEPHLYTTTNCNILCTATDVGMHGLLASQSCYHSVFPLVWVHCWPVADFFIAKQTSLHPFDFVRNLFHLLVCILFFILSKICGSTSPPTHYEPHPHLVWPTSAKNRYLNSRLVILHASELTTELFDELQSPICMFTMSISRPQS